MTPSASSTSAAFAPVAWRTGSRNGREPASRWWPARRRGMTDVLVDADALREQVKEKYREVALDPDATFHFHTGRTQAARLGYEPAAVDALPDRAVESFAGVGNPFSLRRLDTAERVVDVG